MTVAAPAVSERMLRIGVLGPLTVERCGVPVRIPGARLRVLVCLLALSPGRAVAVDELVEALWGERAPGGASSTIRSHVARLRRVLGEHAVVTDAGGYRLASDGVEVDQLVLARARVAVRAGDALEVGELRPVLDRWRGAPFPELIDWLPAVIAARSLTEDYLFVHERCVDLEIAGGQARAVVAELEGLVGDHPFRESLWVRLARARYLSDDRAGALQACREARRRLADEVGVEPSAELAATERSILDQTLGPRTGPPVTLLARPFVGRRAELAVLGEAVNATGATVVVVTGEAGIGKSCLLDEFVTGIRGGGHRVGVGRADDEPQRVFAALHAVISGLGHDPAAVIGCADRVAQVEAFRRALQSVGQRTTVVVDDAQWLGDDEVSVLAQLTMRAGLNVCWVLALRSDAVAAGGSLSVLLDQLSGDSRSRRIELGVLDRQHVGELATLAGVADSDLATVTDLLVQRAGGHPLYTGELLRSAGGHRVADALVGGAVPGGVGGLVAQRLHRLGTGATALIDVAAVAGETFTIGDVARAAGLPTAAAVELFDRGAAAGLFRSGPRPAEGAFSHALIREAVLASLTFARRAALHAAVADAVDGRRVASAAEVAGHTHAAGDLVDAAVAGRRYGRAAQECLDAGGYEEALRWASEADRVEPSTATACVRIRALLRLGRANRALDALGALLEQSDAAVGPALRAITGDLAEHTQPMTRSSRSPLRRAADRAFALAERSDPSWPRIALGWARTREFDTPNRVVFDVVDRAARRAQAQGDGELAAAALIARMERGASPRCADQTLRIADELIAIANVAGRSDWLGWGRASRVSALLQLGRLDQGRREAAELVGDPVGATEPVVAAARALAPGWRAVLDGDLPGFAGIIRAAQPALAGVMPELAAGAVDGHLAMAAAVCGVHDPAHPGMSGHHRSEYARVDWFIDEGDAYRDNVEWGPFAIVAVHDTWNSAVSRYAEPLRSRLADINGLHLVVPFTNFYGGAVDHHLAAMDTLSGRLDDAIDRLEQVIPIYERLGSALYRALALEVLATALHRRRRAPDRSRAAAAAAQARVLAASTHHGQLNRRLALLG